MTHKVAICVGHSRLINGRPEGGAVSVGGVNEWTYNSELGRMIQDELAKSGIESFVVQRYAVGNGYGSAQRWLADHLRAMEATVAIELHFNDADNKSATGHEHLHWHTSKGGKRLASCLDESFRDRLPELRPRGPVSIEKGERGDVFLYGTHCPAVIVESFFGCNSHDWEIATIDKPCIAHAIAAGVVSWIG